MAQIRVLGACSGTEPMEGLHHTSLLLTVNGSHYFFDAGENCSHTAYVSGADLLKTRAVFISHTHYDHIGGLMGIFWTINKLNKRYKKPLESGELKVFIPEVSAGKAILGALECADYGLNRAYDVVMNTPKLGRFFEDENIKLFAFESHHLPVGEDGHIRSFSYLIEVGGKRIVFSGDVRDMDDLAPVVLGGCDLLFCETGHHRVADVCRFVNEHSVKGLVLTHHGREILEKRPTLESAIASCNVPVQIAFDGMTLEC